MKITVEFANGYTWVADIKQVSIEDVVACVLDDVHNECGAKMEADDGHID